MPEAALAVPPQDGAGDDEPDTEAEFKSLWTDATEGRSRLSALSRAATESGHPEIAKVYDEISETVMGLLVDLTAATGAAIIAVEDDIDELPDPGDATPDASTLLEEDAEKYLQLFDQYIRLLDGLEEVIPEGADGDKQRDVFATLRRMTEGMIEFTNSITDDDDDDEPTGEDAKE